jgi:hypothetical protein
MQKSIRSLRAVMLSSFTAFALTIPSFAGDQPSFVVYAGNTVNTLTSPAPEANSTSHGKSLQVIDLDGKQTANVVLDKKRKTFTVGKTNTLSVVRVFQPAPSEKTFTVFTYAFTTPNALNTNGSFVEAEFERGKDQSVQINGGGAIRIPKTISGTQDLTFTGGTGIGDPSVHFDAIVRNTKLTFKLQEALTLHINEIPSQTFTGALDEVRNSLVSLGYTESM